MPFVRFQPASFSAQADPFTEILSALLSEDKPASHCKPAANCTPAQCQTRSCAPRQNRVVKRFIVPKFDISETEEAYVLEGELPGVSNKSTISVDFDDAQTIVVKGEISRVKRNFNKHVEESEDEELTEEALQASAAATQEKTTVTTVEGETVVYDDAASVVSSKSKGKAATVEDDVDESDTASNASFEVVDGPTKADKGKSVAKDTDVEMSEVAEKPAEPTATATLKAKKVEKNAKYWVAERPIGVFERKFKFEGLIDQDNVRAHLENGLLTVVVPKREAFVRSIFIN